MVITGVWVPPRVVIFVGDDVDAGVGLVTTNIVDDGAVVVMDPPLMSKVELYRVRKVRDRYVMTTLWETYPSFGVSVGRSRHVQFTPPTKLSSSLLVKLSWSHLISISP